MKQSSESQYTFESKQAEIFPKYLMYDITNVCNAQCSHCPHSIIANDRKYSKSHLSLSDFEKTINEISKYDTNVVRITGDGEPLLHPHIVNMLHIATELGIKNINLTTNGSLLKGDLLRDIVNLNPAIIDISLDAYSEEVYNKVRKGLNYNNVLSNIDSLLEIRDKNKTKVGVSFVVQSLNNFEVDNFYKYWVNKVDFVALRDMHTNRNLNNDDSINAENIDRWPCQHLWGRLIVDYRGHIRYCPVDWQDLSVLGHVDDMSLFEAWHSDTLNNLRNAHRAMDFDKLIPCGDCLDWRFSPWDKGWLKLMNKIRND